MNEEQRKLFAKGSVDMANIVAGALIFGQFISGRSIDFGIISFGIIITLALYYGGYRFSKIGTAG